MPEIFKRHKPHVNIGTIGHANSGKTTLTSAITKYLADKQLADYADIDAIDKTPEERAKSITIMNTHLEYETETRHYAHIDCPGHIFYAKNLITGLAQMDGAILVINANEFPALETREHILLAKLAGVSALVVFMNCFTPVDDPELLELEIQELLVQCHFPGENVPIVWGSALEALASAPANSDASRCIHDLLAAIDTHIATPERALDSPFLLPIEKVLNIKGCGTVATGRIERGAVHLNDPVEIFGLGETRPSVVKGIEMFHKLLDQGQAGDNVGISLSNTRREDLKRGMVIAHPGSVTTCEETKVDMYILTHQEGGRHKPFSTGFKPQFFLRTLDITGTLNLPEGHDRAMPGDLIQGATVHLYHPVALEVGLLFAVRHSEQTIGAGMITEVLN